MTSGHILAIIWDSKTLKCCTISKTFTNRFSYNEATEALGSTKNQFDHSSGRIPESSDSSSPDRRSPQVVNFVKTETHSETVVSESREVLKADFERKTYLKTGWGRDASIENCAVLHCYTARLVWPYPISVLQCHFRIFAKQEPSNLSEKMHISGKTFMLLYRHLLQIF